jgi:hypothetical protein
LKVDSSDWIPRQPFYFQEGVALFKSEISFSTFFTNTLEVETDSLTLLELDLECSFMKQNKKRLLNNPQRSNKIPPASHPQRETKGVAHRQHFSR